MQVAPPISGMGSIYLRLRQGLTPYYKHMVLFDCLSVRFAWTLKGVQLGEGDDEDDEKDVDDGGASERKLQRISGRKARCLCYFSSDLQNKIKRLDLNFTPTSNALSCQENYCLPIGWRVEMTSIISNNGMLIQLVLG